MNSYKNIIIPAIMFATILKYGVKQIVNFMCFDNFYNFQNQTNPPSPESRAPARASSESPRILYPKLWKDNKIQATADKSEEPRISMTSVDSVFIFCIWTSLAMGSWETCCSVACFEFCRGPLTLPSYTCDTCGKTSDSFFSTVFGEIESTWSCSFCY